MDGNFVISKSNHISFRHINSIRDNIFRAWAQFLNDFSIVRYALTAEPILNEDLL